MSQWLQDKILNLAVKHLVKGISIDDVILFNREMTKAYSRGLEIPKERLIKLKEEVEYISHSFFWRDICDKNIRYEAQEKAISGGDVKSAQTMIFNLDIIKKAIRDIQNFNIGKK